MVVAKLLVNKNPPIFIDTIVRSIIGNDPPIPPSFFAHTPFNVLKFEGMSNLLMKRGAQVQPRQGLVVLQVPLLP